MLIEIDQSQAQELLDGLTDKQVEVLDQLVLHRTTKEIARDLSIAPNTVDQRIAGVREKWGTTNRKQTARHYAHLRQICGKTTCGFSGVDAEAEQAESLLQDLPDEPFFELSDAMPMDSPFAGSLHGLPEWLDDKQEVSKPVGLEALDRKFGRIGRVAAILVLALIMAMTLATSLAIAEALDRLI